MEKFIGDVIPGPAKRKAGTIAPDDKKSRTPEFFAAAAAGQ
jgi:hypothetical protein